MRLWIGVTLSLFTYASFGVHVTSSRGSPAARISGVLLAITFLELVIFCAVTSDS